jgi:hypothetical protein
VTTARRPVILGSLVAVCAIVAVVATFSRHWIVNHDGDGVGPLGGIQCYEGTCEHFGWQRYHAPADVELIGFLAVAAGVIAGALGLVSALQAIRRRPAPLARTATAFTVAAIVMAAFAVRTLMAVTLGGGLDADWAGFAALGSLVVGRVVLGLLTRRVARAPA